MPGGAESRRVSLPEFVRWVFDWIESTRHERRGVNADLRERKALADVRRAELAVVALELELARERGELVQRGEVEEVCELWASSVGRAIERIVAAGGERFAGILDETLESADFESLVSRYADVGRKSA
jgi:hypothetical protein